jgi:hypothetical protein
MLPCDAVPLPWMSVLMEQLRRFIKCNLQLTLFTLLPVFFSAGSVGAIAGGAVVAFLAVVAAIAAGFYYLCNPRSRSSVYSSV